MGGGELELIPLTVKEGGWGGPGGLAEGGGPAPASLVEGGLRVGILLRS